MNERVMHSEYNVVVFKYSRKQGCESESPCIFAFHMDLGHANCLVANIVIKPVIKDFREFSLH